MSVVTSMHMPVRGASLAAYEEAARMLSAVLLTPDQIERGYVAMVEASEHDLGIPALIAFAQSEGLASPVVAAHAIRVRALQAMDALCDGVDLKADAPDVYEAIMMGPIYPGDLGYYPIEQDNDD